jgi:hypothetical protein
LELGLAEDVAASLVREVVEPDLEGEGTRRAKVSSGLVWARCRSGPTRGVFLEVEIGDVQVSPVQI